MAFNREASGDLLQHDKVVNSGLQYGLAAEAHLALATLSAILIDLCESYYAIVDGVGGCLNGLFRVGELDLVVQEALAAYERQVLRRNATFTVDDDDDGDVCDWVSLLSRRVQGRVRHRCGLIADVNITDWQPAAISDGTSIDSFQGYLLQSNMIIIAVKFEIKKVVRSTYDVTHDTVISTAQMSYELRSWRKYTCTNAGCWNRAEI